MFFILLSIVLVDIFLLVDNIIPIVYLADSLKKRAARNTALGIGLTMGGLFRIILVFFATYLFRFGDIVYAIAGAFLVYIAVKGLREKGEEETEHTVKSPSFWGVLVSIVLVDISLSFDNIVALAAISQHFVYLAIGIFIDVVLLFVMSFFLSVLTHKVKGLDIAAYIAILFLAIKFFVHIIKIDISSTMTSSIIVAICIITVGVVYMKDSVFFEKALKILSKGG